MEGSKLESTIASAVMKVATEVIGDQIRKEVHSLKGVDKEIVKLSNDLNKVREILEDAEKKGPFEDKMVKDWLEKLEETYCEMKQVLEEWDSTHTKGDHHKHLSFIPSSPLHIKDRHDMAKKIKIVEAKLDAVLAEKNRYGFHIVAAASTS
ncbi:hypothetical protein ABFS83_09G108500 [Erythranthe nasuta]